MQNNYSKNKDKEFNNKRAEAGWEVQRQHLSNKPRLRQDGLAEEVESWKSL